MQKTSGVKKNAQTKQYKTKNSSEISLNSFYLGHLLLAWGLLLSAVYIPSKTTLEKTNFSFAVVNWRQVLC